MAKSEESGNAGKTETRYRVVINSDSGPGGTGLVSLTINGRVTSVQRDREVRLTPQQLEVLQNARVRDYAVSDEGDTRVVSGRRRFSYAVLGREEVSVGSLDTGAVTGNAADGDAAA